MANRVNKVSQEDANKVAEKVYDPSDYQANDALSQRIAITHEQSTDSYVEGTINGKIDNVDENGSLKSGQGRNIR